MERRGAEAEGRQLGEGCGYLPHTARDEAAMLEKIGVPSIDALFAQIPDEVRLAAPPEIGPGLDEQSLARLLQAMAAANSGAGLVCFAGGGYYDRYLPAAQQSLLSRGEFLTAYTPYQPEVSQGTLQVTFEFQTMIAELTGLPVATAGLYDGSTALAEAAAMARAATGRPRVAFAPGLHPEWVEVLSTYGGDGGMVPLHEVGDGRDIAAVIVQQPDHFGRVCDLGRVLRERPAGSIAIAAVDPATLGVLEAPGALGAEIVVGEGQSVGLPLGYGGPYLGFMAAADVLLRRLPGRICGRTLDAAGRRAFVLTLQAREQHIRRAKATSNVCTNEALCALAVTIYLGLLGPVGLRRLGELCLARAHYAADRLTSIPGVALAYPDDPFFAEFALRVGDAPGVIDALAARGYLVGPAIDAGSLLVAVTEKRDRADIDGLADALREVVTGAGA